MDGSSGEPAGAVIRGGSEAGGGGEAQEMATTLMEALRGPLHGGNDQPYVL